MTQTTEFIVVVSDNEDYLTGYHVFAEKVNRKLRVGFALHGPPVIADRMMCQAMTRLINVDGNDPFPPSGDPTYFQRKIS